MKINFTGHDIEVSEALKNLIEKKFQRIERHFNHNITSANVILSVQKLQHKAEINLLIAGAEINAHAVNEDMYKAIDSMLARLNKQLMKHKEKMSDHH
jgi:putative sigma-54 modulation protein